MANLDQIMDYLADEFTTEEVGSGSAIALSAETIGTAVTTKSVDVSKTGYVPIAATFSQYSHPSGYNAIFSLSGNNLLFIFYRASSSAYTIPADDLKVLVLYKKVVAP